jgi:hypothetical protein
MRTILRALIVSATLGLVIAGPSAALAASPSDTGAWVERYDFDTAWCFDYGTTYDCTTVDAALFVTTTPGGRDIARITYREIVTTFDQAGLEIGQQRTVSFDRTVFADGGQDSSFSVSHTRAVGEYGTCVTTYLFKVVDYELQLDRYTGPGCS